MSKSKTLAQSPGSTQAAAATTTPTLNKNLVITNNSSSAVSMLDALATDDNQVVFEQSLKLLPTTTGATSIAANSVGTVVLDDSHMNNGTPTYTKLYDVIYVKPGTLFPVMSRGAMLDHTTQAYAPVTITDDDVNVMKQTEAFTQTIAAYPTSTLAQNYANALQSSVNNSDDADTLDDAVSAFFASTKAYPDVTLDSVVALKSYYDTYPQVWADYKSTKTYYFYSSDGTKVSASGSLTINIPTTIGLDKTLPGFSFIYTDANNNATPLSYIDGQFVDNPNTDVPNICFAGTFVVKSTLTKVDTDTMIIPILSGTVYNTTVLGYDTQIDQNNNSSDPNDQWSGLYALLHPKDAAGWMQLFLTFVGVTMGIDFVMKAAKSVKDKFVETAEDLDGILDRATAEQAKSAIEQNGGLNDPKYKSKMAKIKQGDAAKKSLSDQMKDADATYQDRATEDWRTATDTKLDKMSDMLEKMLDSGHATSAMEDADDALSDAYTKVDNSSVADLKSQITELNQTVENLRTSINTQFEAVINKLKGTAQTELNDAKAEADEASKTAEKVTDDVDKANEGDTPSDAKPKESGSNVEDVD